MRLLHCARTIFYVCQLARPKIWGRIYREKYCNKRTLSRSIRGKKKLPTVHLCRRMYIHYRQFFFQTLQPLILKKKIAAVFIRKGFKLGIGLPTVFVKWFLLFFPRCWNTQRCSVFLYFILMERFLISLPFCVCTRKRGKKSLLMPRKGSQAYFQVCINICSIVLTLGNICFFFGKEKIVMQGENLFL